MISVQYIFNRLSVAVILILTACCLLSCHRKDLIYIDSVYCQVDIRFDWENATDASVEGMSVFFFPLDPCGKVWNYEIAGSKGGTVVVPPGNYHLVTLNNDLPGVDLAVGDVPESVMIMARPYGDDYFHPSGMVYGAVVADVCVTPWEVTYTGEGMKTDSNERVIRVCADSLSTVYNICFEEITNSDKIVRAAGLLSGPASSLCVDGDRTDGRSCAIAFPLQLNSDGCLRGVTTGLGTPPGIPEFVLTLNLELNDGRKIAKSFDVSAAVADAPNPRNIFIFIDHVEIEDNPPPGPPDEDDDVGLGVRLDGWVTFEITLTS